MIHSPFPDLSRADDGYAAEQQRYVADLKAFMAHGGRLEWLVGPDKWLRIISADWHHHERRIMLLFADGATRLWSRFSDTYTIARHPAGKEV